MPQMPTQFRQLVWIAILVLVSACDKHDDKTNDRGLPPLKDAWHECMHLAIEQKQQGFGSSIPDSPNRDEGQANWTPERYEQFAFTQCGHNLQELTTMKCPFAGRCAYPPCGLSTPCQDYQDSLRQREVDQDTARRVQRNNEQQGKYK
jgi:hypothetical protein